MPLCFSLYFIVYPIDSLCSVHYNIGTSKRQNKLTERSIEMKKSKISLQNGYTLTINEDDTLVLTVESFEGETLEFDGIKGNLMDASDFESHYADEDIEYTVAEYKYGSLEFLTDWGVDKKVAEAIVEELTPWFQRYAVDQPTADAWLKVLEDRVEELRKKTEMHEDNVNKAIAQFKEWVSAATDFDIYYGAEERGKRVTSVRETYKAVWEEYKKAEAELFRYKEVMHIA